MVTAKYLTEKLIVPMRERLRDEGRKEGREEGIEVGIEVGEGRANRKWVDWYLSKTEADEKGIPFDEPPPAPLNGEIVAG